MSAGPTGILKRVVQVARHSSDVSRERPRARGSLIDGQTVLQQIDHRTSAGTACAIHLRFRRRLAGLVEKVRAAVGRFEPPDALKSLEPLSSQDR